MNVNRIGGAGVGGNDDSGGPDSYLRSPLPRTTPTWSSCSDHLSKAAPSYVYRVEVSPVAAAADLGLSERSQFVDIVAPVAKGNRLAFLVNAARADFGGELNLEFKDLPPGVTVETLPMAANRGDVPVLFTAAADAAVGGSLVDIVGRPADANLKIEGHLRQRTSLVRGQNNIDVWNQDADRLATAVTEEAPYSIEIVEPKVPIVADGSMDLKVVATRKEGFTAPISVQMLYNPPGIGSSGSIQIPEGQNEAVIPLTANGGAEMNNWKIAVLGDSAEGRGSITVASQLADLEVAAPFLAFDFQPAVTEKGQKTDVVIKVTKQTDFEGGRQDRVVGTAQRSDQRSA